MTTRRHIENIPDGIREHIERDYAPESGELFSTWEMCTDAEPRYEMNEVRKAEIRQHVLAVASREDRTSVSRVRLFRVKSYAVAAVVIILVGLGFVLSPGQSSIRAPQGHIELTDVQLPDGSTVVLAPGSRISFSDSFGEENRRVTLTGEAFFDVQSSGSTFTVDTYNATTVVHGTRFSVRAWPSDIQSATDVRVEEGSVSVQARYGSEWNVLLETGEGISVEIESGQNPSKQTLDATRAFTWLDGGYEYKNEPIGNVLDDLQRQYGLVINAPSAVKLRPISIFNQAANTLEEVLGDISATVGVKFRAISGGYELYEAS